MISRGACFIYVTIANAPIPKMHPQDQQQLHIPSRIIAGGMTDEGPLGALVAVLTATTAQTRIKVSTTHIILTPPRKRGDEQSHHEVDKIQYGLRGLKHGRTQNSWKVLSQTQDTRATTYRCRRVLLGYADCHAPNAQEERPTQKPAGVQTRTKEPGQLAVNTRRA